MNTVLALRAVFLFLGGNVINKTDRLYKKYRAIINDRQNELSFRKTVKVVSEYFNFVSWMYMRGYNAAVGSQEEEEMLQHYISETNCELTVDDFREAPRNNDTEDQESWESIKRKYPGDESLLEMAKYFENERKKKESNNE